MVIHATRIDLAAGFVLSGAMPVVVCRISSSVLPEISRDDGRRDIRVTERSG
jgi:hypothetical protein